MPMTPFLNMFGRSPIRPLEEHMAKVYACVQELPAFFAAVFDLNWVQAESIQQKIVGLEDKADGLKRDLRSHLPKGLFMPFSRSDLLDLLNVQDRLANTAKDIAGVVLGRQMTFPAEIIVPYKEFLDRNVEASKQANIAIHELDELLETGFSGSEIKLVDSMIATLTSIEHETDEQQVHLRHALFPVEQNLPPVNVMFLYKIIEWTGDLADDSRDIGDRLQILLAR